jgi:hypothetical protein
MSPSPAPRPIVLGVAVLALALALFWPRGRAPSGNSLVLINAGQSSLDSVIVEPEPASTVALRGAIGYVARQDSVTLALPAGAADANVKIYRGGSVVAHHVAYWGGESVFEVRVGDSTSLGRYRRTGPRP